jgi:oligogalacturonide transporter
MLTFVWFFTWERPREEWTEAALRAEEEKKPDFGSEPEPPVC